MVVIVDFSFKPDTMKEVIKKTTRIIWIDHHKTAEAYDYGVELDGVRDFTEPGKSGALLAWEYFYPNHLSPAAVDLVSDYDTWQHKLPDDKEFVLGLMAQSWSKDPKSKEWRNLFLSGGACLDLVEQGQAIARYRDSKCQDYCSMYGFPTEIDGHEAFAVNLYSFGSHTFGERMGMYPICIAFAWDGEQYTVSLYSDIGVDTSVISKKYGGGGHSAASGFQCKELPFKRILGI